MFCGSVHSSVAMAAIAGCQACYDCSNSCGCSSVATSRSGKKSDEERAAILVSRLCSEVSYCQLYLSVHTNSDAEHEEQWKLHIWKNIKMLRNSFFWVGNSFYAFSFDSIFLTYVSLKNKIGKDIKFVWILITLERSWLAKWQCVVRSLAA